jgi:uncharacterized membrane protein (DUF485 family)
MVCTGYELKSLEGLLGAAVGVGFILPVVNQMLVERANKLLSLSRILLQELQGQDDRFSLRDLGSVRIDFQSRLKKIERASDAFVLISSLSSLLAFILLVVSAYTPVCLTAFTQSSIVIAISIPVVLCGGLFIWWWDASRTLLSRYYHYYDQ